MLRQADLFNDHPEFRSCERDPVQARPLRAMRRSLRPLARAVTAEIAARVLDASDDYRVLRRLQPRTLSGPRPCGSGEKRTVIVDTETTGLDHQRHEVIELGMVAFVHDGSGTVLAVTDEFSALQEPSRPLDPEITRLTGITDAMLAGQTIDIEAVEAFIADADLVIAHNAGFDRPFCERMARGFVPKPWACSVKEVDWAGHGYEGSKLGYLVGQSGWFHTGHRAADDCHALLAVLTAPLPKGDGSALGQLLLRSEAARPRPLIATVAPTVAAAPELILEIVGRALGPDAYAYQETACTISFASKCRPLKSSLDRRFNLDAMAFRIIDPLRKGAARFSQQAFDPSPRRGARSRGSRPCCGCAKASGSRAPGPCASRTGCSGSASDFQRLIEPEAAGRSRRSAPQTRVCDKPGFRARGRFVPHLDERVRLRGLQRDVLRRPRTREEGSLAVRLRDVEPQPFGEGRLGTVDATRARCEGRRRGACHCHCGSQGLLGGHLAICQNCALSRCGSLLNINAEVTTSILGLVLVFQSHMGVSL